MTTTAARIVAPPGPIVAIVGRPNVGKSTLVNRLIGRREVIVEERPGVTRDRTAHEAEWRGRRFTVVDTGGWTAAWASRGVLDEAVTAQAELATETADLVVFVVDATVGVTEEDGAVADWLRSSGGDVVLVANKVDRQGMEAELGELYRLGIGDPVPVSALHGHGSGDLLDVVVDRLAEAGAFRRHEPSPADVTAVALIGQPNVGKSSLFNRLVGEQRSIVDPKPGTTRDAVDTVVELENGRAYRFVDTAGLRRRLRKLEDTEYYGTVRTVQALDRAAVALLMIDASEPIGEHEQKLARQVLDAGRAVVVVLNKWDLVDEERREQLRRERQRLLGFIDFAPIVRTSAVTGRGVAKLWPAIDAVLAEWQRRIPTGELNRWLGDAVAANPPPLHAHRPVRIRYGTQVAVGPPRFRVFATGELQPGYLRYLERKLRESFGFEGTPVDIGYRVRPRWEERGGGGKSSPNRGRSRRRR